MASGKNTSRPNQFGITLSEEAAQLLISSATRLKTPPSTLAAFLVEQALANLGTKAPASEAKLLQAIRRELAALSDSHHNATIKLLNTAGGLTVAEVREWAGRFLKK